MFTCPSCGAPMKDGQMFCSACGAQTANVNQGANGAYTNDAQQPLSAAPSLDPSAGNSSYGSQDGYGAPAGGYGAPAGGYGAPAGGYGAPAGGYGAPAGGYGAPAGGYGAAAGYGAMGGFPTRGAGTPVSFGQKNIVTCIILSIVTCGIYGIVWFIDMVNNLNEATGDPAAKSGGTVFLLGLVTCGIYLFIWLYKAGEQVNIAKSSRGLMVDSNSGVMYLLLGIFGLSIVSYAMIQSELNKIAALYGAPAA